MVTGEPQPGLPAPRSPETAGATVPPAAPTAPPAASGWGPVPPMATIADVRMVTDTAVMTAGARVAIRIQIAGANDVGSVPFHLLYNPAVLHFERGEEGEFLRGDGRQTAFFAAPATDPPSVVVGLSRLGRGSGMSGSGELCVLHFTTIGAGDAGTAFTRAKVRDSENRIVRANFSPVSLTVR